MPFDSEDMQMSNTRSEPLITQRIGNVVSHQRDNICVYDNSYVIDKTTRPATWTILTGLQSKGTLNKISHHEVEKRKQRRHFNPQKVDWQSVNQRRSELGRLGEKFVVRFETGIVCNFAPFDTGRIVHLSEEQGDGAGFDIVSLNPDGTDKFIEVKTTVGPASTPFYMSENERMYFVLNRYENNSFIYRVFNFDQDNMTGEIICISAEELFTQYHFDPISYRVSISN